MLKKSRKISKTIKGKKSRVAIVASRFNEAVCDGLIWGAQKALAEAGYTEKDFTLLRVPGAFEIPLVASACLKTKKYAGVVCLGAVIRGDTPHFDYVCRAVTDGVREVSLKMGKPCSFGVITVDNLEQAIVRSSHDDYNKGYESTVSVIEMIDLLKQIKM